MNRRVKQLPPITLGASQVEANVPAVSLGPESRLDVQIVIDDGAGGVPTDTPTGTWRLLASPDGVTFSHVADADAGLAPLAAAGNTLVSRWVAFSHVPGSSIKLVYVRSGGGATSRARVALVTA